MNTGTGASANVKFATGSFAMQSTWANDANSGCEMSHSIVKCPDHWMTST
ncbi:hypothetical protein [Kitasatospora acidiphila]|nr:hypothetical protein [Kitasatospora acidiphila]